MYPIGYVAQSLYKYSFFSSPARRHVQKRAIYSAVKKTMAQRTLVPV
nr:MAG TPA_asm: hypothetical protein [Caudoviricetes sp.]